MSRPELSPDWPAASIAAFDAEPRIHATWKTGELRDWMLEIWISGDWLRHRLLERGASEEVCSQMQFAAGQRCVGRDPWVVVKAELDRYDAGTRLVPGRELADALIYDKPPPVVTVDRS